MNKTNQWTPEELRQIADLTKRIGKAIGKENPRIAAAACLAVIELSCNLVHASMAKGCES